jgi:hypothetical protein
VSASKELTERFTIRVLAECKYCSDHQFWLFNTFPDSQEVFMSDLGYSSPRGTFEIKDKKPLYDPRDIRAFDLDQVVCWVTSPLRLRSRCRRRSTCQP